ncbi:hypothetical protein EMCRGX_G021802 [Ephydatia muelleri]
MSVLLEPLLEPAPDSEPTVPSSKSPVTKEDENDDENLVVEEKVQIEEPAQPPPPPPTIEKIAEEDKRRPHPVKRALYKVFPFLEKREDLRRVAANDRTGNAGYKYADNVVVSAKYNIFTFVPLNLFEQFMRVANIYFLVLVILQSIPQISSVPYYTTLIPLIIVLLITAIKDGYDDIKRHISDYQINNRRAAVLSGTGLTEVKWKDVRVGDVLKLKNDEFVTADLLLLSSSEPNSLVFIETAELDGETNLKVRQALPITAELGANEDQLSTFNGYIECEPPNNRLHKFVGTLHWNNATYSLDNEKVLLRGCRLRNTEWMYGVVIYAGSDTKLVQNSGRTKFKRTHLEQAMNKLVFFILCFLIGCLFVAFIGSLIFEFIYIKEANNFFPYNNYLKRTASPSFVQSILQVFSNLIVLNTFIPISLYVSVEIIRLGLSLFINSDIKMYYEPNNVAAIARTTTLNEELGQVEYIFSDKTGTLTQNVMTFLKCSINGVRYGDSSSSISHQKRPVDFRSWNRYADANFAFYDQTLLQKFQEGDQHCQEFFLLLSLCHTVIPKDDKAGQLVYNSQSPDEAALVSAAKNFGFVFKSRTPFLLTVQNIHTGNEVSYEILNILDFNNERKRMSVITRIDSKIVLYCKGADNVIFERMNGGSAGLKTVLLDHLSDYAEEGLRTLVCAKREISEEEYTAWAEEHHAASIIQKNRDEALDAVYEKIEKNLVLLGATAIEDKLQDGVPDTIANLARANIKIWVLTGDKQETAVNIGYSSKLLTDQMKVFIVDKDSKEEVQMQLEEANSEILKMSGTSGRNVSNYKHVSVNMSQIADEATSNTGKKDTPPFGIVINGHSLRHALKDELRDILLTTAEQCKAVICCRVTPLQKKKVVDMVKIGKKAVTLAIGDGANDVGMIKAAHIGVGISGLEGQQAVLASDYSFGQFRYLERLLLVHGRWSYHRMTIFLRYFFYKNFAFAFSQFIFAFFCGFSAQPLYDPGFITFYNVIYTSLPVLAVSILDQDLSESRSIKNPDLYRAGQKNEDFNFIIFLRSIFKGIYAAFVVFFVLFGITFLDIMPNTKSEWDFQSFGLTASAALVFIVNIQIVLDAYYMNPFFHISVCSSMVSWFPKQLNRLQIDKSDRIREDVSTNVGRDGSSVRRSGYAFAQIRGFGQLITNVIICIPQKVLSGMVQAQQFHILLESSSPDNRACLLSVEASHASSWLWIVPSRGLGLHLESNEYQMAIRWWLGLDTSCRSMCPFCPDTAPDPLGHHAVTCRHGEDVVICHNRLRDEVLDLCRGAHLSVSVERGHGLTRDLAHTRPADILIAGWDRGKPVALDLTITSSLCSAILSESCHQAGAAAPLKWSKMPKVGLFLHSISYGDIWQLGQGGPRYLLQAGVLPGHSPVLP